MKKFYLLIPLSGFLGFVSAALIFPAQAQDAEPFQAEYSDVGSSTMQLVLESESYQQSIDLQQRIISLGKLVRAVCAD